MKAVEKLKIGWSLGYLICVGLDTDPEKIPPHLIEECRGDELDAMFLFNKEIVDSTKDIVNAYKINIAFYEKYGPAGLDVFYETIEYICEKAPDVFLILDVKRGDIGNTNEGYATYLEKADAITISGYFGKDANEPFLAERFKEKIIIVLAKTSNKGSAEIQDLVARGMPIYLHMAKNVMSWGENCAIVVGGTHPSHLLQARAMIGSTGLILVPGVGAQGADLKSVIIYGTNEDGGGILINVSRLVIYASKGEDFAKKAREEVLRMNGEIATYLELPKIRWEIIMPTFYEEKTFKILAEQEAVLKDDHFVYQAGQHGTAYLAKDKVTLDPIAIDEIGRMLADLMKNENIETIAVPAAGGIVLGHAVARHLSYFKGKTIYSIFVEKTGKKNEDNTDEFQINRGYEEKVYGKNVAILEDIMNSGSTVKNVLKCIQDAYGNVTTVGAICNRGGVKAKDIDNKIKLINLSVLNLEKHEADTCPLCANNVPINTKFGHGKDFLAKK